MTVRQPILAAAAVSTLLVLGCAALGAAGLVASPATAQSQGDEKTFRWAFQSDVQTLDPHGLYETMTLHFQSNLYDALVTRDAGMELRPALATSWENTAPDTWVFTLREGVRFHNGNAFDADDVLFSLERIRSEGSDLKTVASRIASARRIDDLTVEFTTPRPDPIFPSQLDLFLIMDKEWAEEHGTTEATNVKGGEEANFANLNANGTGPYRLAERQPDVRTVLERNDDWWGWEEQRGNVTQAVFTPIGQDATRLAALIAGDLDMAYPVPIQDWERLDATEGVEPLTGPELRTIFLGFDQARDELLYSDVEGANPFKDQRVREAFLRAVDVEAIKSRVMRGAARPTGLMVAPQVNGWSEELDQRMPADPDRARALLAEAGYPEGFAVTLDCPNDRYVNDERICLAVASMLARVGIEVEVNAQPRSKYFAKILAQGGYDTSFYLVGWTPATLDSLDVIRSVMSCRTETSGQFNIGGYCNERINELADEIQVEIDPARRQALIDQVFEIHKREVGHLPLHQQPLSWGVRDGVQVIQRPDNAFHLKTVVMP